MTNLRKCVWRLRKWLQGAQCWQWNGLLENSSSGTRAIQRNTAVRIQTFNGCVPVLFIPMSLALWLTNPGHQSRSVNILSWIFHTHTHTHSGCYFTRMVRKLYSDVFRSSELTTEKLSHRIQRPGTRCYSSETDESRTLKLYSLYHQTLWHSRLITSRTNLSIFAATTIITKVILYITIIERAMEQHQTIKRRCTVVDNHASCLRGPGLTSRARKQQNDHLYFSGHSVGKYRSITSP